MMTSARKGSGWKASALRTRFVPKSRIRHGIVSMSPWLDLILLMVFCLLIESRILLQPGVVVELPSGTFETGVETGMIAVVVTLDTPTGVREMVFFDDEPYAVDDPSRMDALAAAFADFRQTHDETVLTVYTDRNVAHGTVSRLVQVARSVGLQRINMGTRPDG